jgi:cytochrome c biogenesis protein CcdA
MKMEDVPRLMFIYGIGYILIYILFSCMYFHALKKKEELGLTNFEEFDTITKIHTNCILIGVGVVSVIVSQLLPANYAGYAGFVYVLIGPAFTIYHQFRRRKRKILVVNDK